MHTFKSFIAESLAPPSTAFKAANKKYYDYLEQQKAKKSQAATGAVTKVKEERLDELKVPHPTFIQKHLLGVRSLRDVAKTVHAMPHHELQSLHKHYEKNPAQSIVQAQQHRSIKKALRRYGDAQGTHKPLDKSKFVKKDLHEEEQLDELKSSTLGRYVKTAAGDLTHQSALLTQYKKDYPGNNSPTEQKILDQKARAVKKRRTGIGQATNRLVNRIYGHSKGKDN